MPVRPLLDAVTDLGADALDALGVMRPASTTLGHLVPRRIVRDGVVLEQHLREGRFQRSLAVVAGISGLLGGLEVATQHYRGSYNQRVMWTPVVLAPALLVGGIGAAFSRTIARTLLPAASVLLLADGVVGFGFHVRGIARKPGGWRIPVFNVVMGPPVFAPLLLGIGGFLGIIASGLRREDDPRLGLAHRFFGVRRSRRSHWLPQPLGYRLTVWNQNAREGRLQRVLAGATAVSAALNGVEALYSHYKTAYRYRVQWVPVALSPVLVAAGVAGIASQRAAQRYLPIASAAAIVVGGIGFFFHARGVVRRPAGLEQPLYNVTYGPPVFAPLLYAATGFLGLLASALRRRG
jgi:hypothetical protein